MASYFNKDVNYSDVSLNASFIQKLDINAKSTFWGAEALNEIAPVLCVMIATLIGNLVLIVLLVYKPTRRRKRVNVFIINLGIADLTVAMITMTTELLEAIFKQWVLGPFLCKCLLYLQVVTLSSTTLLLTGMSIDRYQVIVRPLKALTQRPKIKSKVLTAWIMAFVIAIPQVFIFVQVDVYDKGRNAFVHVCKSSGYSHEWQRKLYFIFLTFYLLVLPAGIMLFCYTAIAKAIWNRGKFNENTPLARFQSGVNIALPQISIRRGNISLARRKVVFMTLSVIVAYLVCLTPYFIICLIRIFSQYSVKLRDELVVSQVIFMMHSALNPILYGLFRCNKTHFKNVCALFNSENQYRGHFQSNSNLLKSPARVSLHRGFFNFKHSNFRETSVTNANHVAKEETSIQLRNREKSKYKLSFPVNSRKNVPLFYAQTGTRAKAYEGKGGSTSSEKNPMSIHLGIIVERNNPVMHV